MPGCSYVSYLVLVIMMSTVMNSILVEGGCLRKGVRCGEQVGPEGDDLCCLDLICWPSKDPFDGGRNVCFDPKD
ncbi:hypothetical protein BDA99DRAFT_520211, partial [Phascolomyces articulosus]